MWFFVPCHTTKVKSFHGEEEEERVRVSDHHQAALRDENFPRPRSKTFARSVCDIMAMAAALFSAAAAES